MNTFAAIDFETANNERTSVCSGKIKKHQFSLPYLQNIAH